MTSPSIVDLIITPHDCSTCGESTPHVYVAKDGALDCIKCRSLGRQQTLSKAEITSGPVPPHERCGPWPKRPCAGNIQ